MKTTKAQTKRDRDFEKASTNMQQATADQRAVAVGSTIYDRGAIYVVEMVMTPESEDAAGHPNNAARLRRHGDYCQMIVRRPKGQKRFWAWQNKNGRFYVQLPGFRPF